MSKAWQFHQSGIDQASKCGIAYENRYMKRIRTPISVAIAVGNGVDRSAMADLQHKIDTAGELLKRDEVADIARDTVVAQFQEQEVRVTDEDTEEGVATSRDEAIDAAVAMSDAHHAELAPKIFRGLDPKDCYVQRPFVLDVPGMQALGHQVQLVGTIDIQQGSVSIDDLKTSGKSPKKTAADESMQLTTYALADYVLRQRAEVVANVALNYVVRTPKRHDVKIVRLESIRKPEQFPPVLERVAALVRAINSGIFLPASPNDWYCSKKYCAFWAKCPYAMRPVSVPVNGLKQEQQ